ncbi:hypothetical protein RJT34_06790 [Clitoria ternatea]|uniref:Uncharacterized protein n=1 Tax=Clitoria ternatea TaxID=43366 RepID=A0AAN9PUI2_CLITE
MSYSTTSSNAELHFMLSLLTDLSNFLLPSEFSPKALFSLSPLPLSTSLSLRLPYFNYLLTAAVVATTVAAVAVAADATTGISIVESVLDFVTATTIEDATIAAAATAAKTTTIEDANLLR